VKKGKNAILGKGKGVFTRGESVASGGQASDVSWVPRGLGEKNRGGTTVFPKGLSGGNRSERNIILKEKERERGRARAAHERKE